MEDLSRRARPEILLTDAATVAIDAAKGNAFRLETAASRTLGAPGTGFPGQAIHVRWKNTGGSPVTLTLTVGSAGAFRYLGSANALNATPAGATEYIVAIYNAADDRWDVVAYSGYEFPGGGPLILDALSSMPGAPAAGKLSLYGRLRHGRAYLDVQGPNGRDWPVQPFLGLNKVVMHLPENGTTIRTWGMPVTNVGTVSHPTLAATNLLTSMRRWRLTSAATANSAAENRAAQTLVWRGNAAGRGGFTFIARFGITTNPSNTGRGFFGLTSATGATPTTQVPSALTNCVGLMWDIAAETNFYIGHNDGAGSCTRVDLGANFPVNDAAAVYTLYLYCGPNDSKICYRVVREDTGDVADGELTTDLPSNTTFLTYHLYMNNGGTAIAVAFDCAGVYLESDF